MNGTIYRVQLHPTGRINADRAQPILKHGFSLDEQEVSTLLDQLPFECVLAPSSPSQVERLVANLSAAGFDVSIEPLAFAREPCSQHRRLARSTSCPRCQDPTCLGCLKLGAGVCPSCAVKLGRQKLFRHIRIVALLVVLFAVALSTWLQKRKITSWDQMLHVGVYPILVESNENTRAYFGSLSVEHFDEVERFLQREDNRYETALQVQIELGPTIEEQPPSIDAEASIFDVMWYSLELRWWASEIEDDYDLVPTDIQIFMLYYASRPGRSLEHSIGLDKGHIGIVRAFADDALTERNNVVVAHELLHTAGATDKYDEQGRPIFPEGYAEPGHEPRLPQELAEIMAGSIPTIDGEVKMAKRLAECVVGKKTATEIGWVEE